MKLAIRMGRNSNFFFFVFLLLLGIGSNVLAASREYDAAKAYFHGDSIVTHPKKAQTENDLSNYFGEGAFIVRQRGMSSGDELDDYDDESTSIEVYDPLEGWNRFWFAFNDRFFVYVAKPLYRGWETITPQVMRTALKNFLHNILFPVRFVNNILQFRLKAAGVEFSRFMLNTMSSAGFANPAKNKKTIVPVDESGEDLGQTFGVWGIGHGPYLVLPFLGPSSVRDALGKVGDMFASPIYYLEPWYAAWGTAGLLRFNALDDVLPLYDDIKGAAIDPYIFMREAYIQHRNNLVKK